MARGDRKSFAKKIPLVGMVLGIAFKWDDTKVEDVFRLDELPKDMIHRLAVHGLGQKLGDLSSKDEVETPADMREAVHELWEQLKDGDWDTRASGPLTREQKIARLEKQLARYKAEEEKAAPISSMFPALGRPEGERE